VRTLPQELLDQLHVDETWELDRGEREAKLRSRGVVLAPDLERLHQLAAERVTIELGASRNGDGVAEPDPIGDADSEASARAIRFVPAAEFAADTAAHPFRALLGEDDDALLVEGGLHLLFGPEGAAKTTLSLDLAAHLAAWLAWLSYRVPRALRLVLIENEGPPAGLRRKLERKIETWTGPAWAERVLVYRDPWGELRLTDDDSRAALVHACEQHRADLVVAGPLLSLGAPTEGKPGDTQAFVDLLRRDCGLGRWAYLLVHHWNKGGAISGDWGRHADTLLEATEGEAPETTRLAIRKQRWGHKPPKPLVLQWILDSEGYELFDTTAAKATDEDYEQRILDYLAEHPWATTDELENDVEGRAAELRRARRRLEEAGRVSSAPSASVGRPGKATRWNLTNHAASHPVPLPGTGQDGPPARPAGEDEPRPHVPTPKGGTGFGTDPVAQHAEEAEWH
jgi:hypothetical protein